MTNKSSWVLCPVCGGKTRIKITERTVIRELPLFCPKCRSETVVNAENNIVTQSRRAK